MLVLKAILVKCRCHSHSKIQLVLKREGTVHISIPRTDNFVNTGVQTKQNIVWPMVGHDTLSVMWRRNSGGNLAGIQAFCTKIRCAWGGRCGIYFCVCVHLHNMSTCTYLPFKHNIIHTCRCTCVYFLVNWTIVTKNWLKFIYNCSYMYMYIVQVN